MKITKTTINMAKRRNISIELMSDSELGDVIEIARIEDGEVADEYSALYAVRDGELNSGLFFINGCDSRISEEFPYWISGDEALRALLDDIALVIG